MSTSILTTRLQARGISPAEMLMVGDCVDSDIEPAHAHGWQTWLLLPTRRTGAEAAGL